MELGVRAIIFTRNHPVEEAARLIADHGLEGVAVPTWYQEYPEYCTRHPAMDPGCFPDGVVQSIVAAFHGAGLKTWVMDAYNNLSAADEEQRAAAVESIRSAIRSAHRFGCDAIVTESGRRDVGGFERCVASLREIMPLAEEAGVDVCVEPSYAQTVPNSWTMRGLIEEVGSDRLKVLLDPANILVYDATNRPFEVLGGRIIFTHAKDCTVDEKGMPGFPPAGQGQVDWHLFIERTIALGDVPLIIEYANEQNIGAVIEFLRQVIREVEGA
ncbi:MAG: sugar phosphate isomerase/epimerase family protein [Armatimonadota bacterium]